MLIRGPTAGSIPCKICQGATHLCGVVDFGRSCLDDDHGRNPSMAGIPIYYRRCSDCEFLFTDAFDDWQEDLFRYYIYNDDYTKVDPSYASSRPLGMAKNFLRRTQHLPASLNVLDYGGGTGAFASHLIGTASICRAETYDPFNSEFASRPSDSFNIVTCYECIEHVSEPLHAIQTMSEMLVEDGVVHVGTGLLTDAISDREAMRWWYVAPRNGHISIFSRKATTVAWGSIGMSVEFLNGNSYAAFRRRSGWAERFIDTPLPDGFDPVGYLACNPDVKAADLDPTFHYRRFGMFEDREWRLDPGPKRD
jgi:Methyltransferase domain